VDLFVRLEGRRDLARQIYRQIRAAILEGRLGRGDRLPPTRELARQLEVSRNTAGLAYEWLTSEGLLSGRAGAGSFVERPAAPRARKSATVASRATLRPRPVWNAISGPPPIGTAPDFDFGVGAPDAHLFPFDTWRRLVAREIRAKVLTSAYGDPAGHPKLRAAVARHIGVSRGVRAGPEDVIVTNGAQQAFDLIGRVLIEPGARVAVEDPGYPPPRLLFESLGAKVACVGCDAEGLDVASLPDDARLVYVTPSHQFPLGMPMSHARRTALLGWAERRNAVVIEDDYDSEFRFGGRPLETLHAIDRTGRVIYVGSFSKVMLPALRLGFLVAPASLQRALKAASYVAGWHCQWPAQAALANFLDGGLLARHIRKMRREYAARHDRILSELAGDSAAWLEPVPSAAGMHLCARLRSPSVSLERDVAGRAHASGLGLDRLSSYCTGEPQAGLVLGYGAIATARVDVGLRRLRTCFVGATRAGAG
jgi:GntR family transcriptional regulator/MocR family aminotransferase